MAFDKEFQTNGYSVQIVSRHLELTESLKDYILEKVGKIDRFAEQILDVVVNLEITKLEHIVSINMKFYHFAIHAKAVTKDLYSSIDKASERLFRLIKKYKTKLKDHKGSHLGDVDLSMNILKTSDTQEVNDDIVDENYKEEMSLYRFHKIVSSEKLSAKMLTQDEAVMKLELSDDHFLIYKSEEDQKIKVLYKKNDEDLALVEID